MYDRSSGSGSRYRRVMEPDVLAVEGVDLEVLARWMDGRGLGDGSLSEVALITGGTQNILLSFERSGSRYVLRRPPLGHVLASAHDMGREHRIISAVARSSVPVAPALALSPDDAVNGAPFYVMGFVDGHVLRDRADAEATLPSLIEAVKRLTTGDRRRVFEERGARLAEISRQSAERARVNASSHHASRPRRSSSLVWRSLQSVSVRNGTSSIERSSTVGGSAPGGSSRGAERGLADAELDRVAGGVGGGGGLARVDAGAGAVLDVDFKVDPGLEVEIRLGGGHAVEDQLFLGLGRIADDDLEHEAVHLGLGQRVGSLLLDRVLRGDHKERVGQLVSVLPGGDLLFGHGLKKRGLGFGRGAVDFISEENVGEDRPLHETEFAGAGGLVKNHRAGDVGRHQVGGELHALERQLHDLTDAAHQQGFRQAGHADQQAMATGEHRGKDLLNDTGLPDNHLAELLEHFLS